MADTPNYNSPSINPGTREHLSGMATRTLNETSDDIAADMNEGTDTSALIAGDPNDGLYQALKNKYEAPYRYGQRSMQAQGQMQAAQQKFDRVVQLNGLLEKEKQINDQIQMMHDEARKAKRRARAAVLGQLIGVAAIGAGAAMGGPVGVGVAMGGANAASGTGQRR